MQKKNHPLLIVLTFACPNEPGFSAFVFFGCLRPPPAASATESVHPTTSFADPLRFFCATTQKNIFFSPNKTENREGPHNYELTDIIRLINGAGGGSGGGFTGSDDGFLRRNGAVLIVGNQKLPGSDVVLVVSETEHCGGSVEQQRGIAMEVVHVDIVVSE